MKSYTSLENYIKYLESMNGTRGQVCFPRIKVAGRIYDLVGAGAAGNAYDYARYMNKRTEEGFTIKYNSGGRDYNNAFYYRGCDRW